MWVMTLVITMVVMLAMMLVAMKVIDNVGNNVGIVVYNDVGCIDGAEVDFPIGLSVHLTECL